MNDVNYTSPNSFILLQKNVSNKHKFEK